MVCWLVCGLVLLPILFVSVVWRSRKEDRANEFWRPPFIFFHTQALSSRISPGPYKRGSLAPGLAQPSPRSGCCGAGGAAAGPRGIPGVRELQGIGVGLTSLGEPAAGLFEPWAVKSAPPKMTWAVKSASTWEWKQHFCREKTSKHWETCSSM